MISDKAIQEAYEVAEQRRKEEEASRIATCQHCWHFTGRVFLSYPPQHESACCHCGLKETQAVALPPVDPNCGPFHPRKTA